MPVTLHLSDDEAKLLLAVVGGHIDASRGYLQETRRKWELSGGGSSLAASEYTKTAEKKNSILAGIVSKLISEGVSIK
jgi:hypothetical protein